MIYTTHNSYKHIYCSNLIVGQYEFGQDQDGSCTIPAGDKVIRLDPSKRKNEVWEVLVIDQRWNLKDGGRPLCTSIASDGLGPKYVSPIAAVSNYTSRGQDCDERLVEKKKKVKK